MGVLRLTVEIASRGVMDGRAGWEAPAAWIRGAECALSLVGLAAGWRGCWNRPDSSPPKEICRKSNRRALTHSTAGRRGRVSATWEAAESR